MQQTINFDEIKSKLLENGYITEEAINQAHPTISVEGEFTRKGGIEITKSHAGFYGKGVAFKGLSGYVSLPEIPESGDEDENEAKLKNELKEMYPGVEVWVRIY